MNIYLENGYLDIPMMRATGAPFVFITAARGTGKTYGCIKSVLTSGERFVFMRRTQTQLDMVKNPKISPFVSPCRDMGYEYDISPLAKGVDSVVINGEHRGYLMALSTMANVRGFEDPNISCILYDEFIPEPQERPIRNECDVFFNAYETLNRNRELEGRKPIQVVASSNSNNILNPIYTGLGMVEKVDKMVKRGAEYWIDRRRGYMLVYPLKSPISQKKAETALYRLAGEGNFADMAIDNKFALNSMGTVKPQNLAEYIPLVTVGELTFYAHKSAQQYYCTTHRSGSPITYKVNEEGLSIFRSKFDRLWIAYCYEQMFFDKYMSEALYRVYMGKRS